MTGKPGNVWYDKSYNAIWFANGMTASNCDVSTDSTFLIIVCISVVSDVNIQVRLGSGFFEKENGRIG